MAVWVEVDDDAERPLAGTRAKGEYRCSDCWYGVTIYRELPSCPMCGGEEWERLDWSPYKAVQTGLLPKSSDL